MAAHVTLYLAQSQETATRLQALGIPPTRIQTPGNLKYDLAPPQPSSVAAWIRRIAAGRPIIVAGSTLPSASASSLSEEEILIQAWEATPRRLSPLLVLAPAPPPPASTRSPPPPPSSTSSAQPGNTSLSTQHQLPACPIHHKVMSGNHRTPQPKSFSSTPSATSPASTPSPPSPSSAAPSSVAAATTPLEAARFGIPILTGPSYENFREIVDGMIAADAIRITSPETLAADLADLLHNGKPLGQRAQTFFQSQSGATARTLAALLPLLKDSTR